MLERYADLSGVMMRKAADNCGWLALDLGHSAGT